VLTPRVSVSVNRMVAMPPRHAYEPIIKEAAQTYSVEPALILSIMEIESAFNPFAVSRAGARGLMQLMPQLAKRLGVKNIFDPRENIMAGARLLRELLDRHDGNLPLVLASYNAGPTAVARYKAIPPYPETQNYVRRVLRTLARTRIAAR
jgi:soluble lytic murein transglycosylase-like protein